MAKFKIPVEWSVFDTVEIEAETLEDAVKFFDENIDEIPLGTQPEYIDGTYARSMMDDEESTIDYYRFLYNQ